MRRIDAIQKPRMVMGCAMRNDRRRAMFSKRDKFATMAKPRETALTAMSLYCQSDHIVVGPQSIEEDFAYQFGSLILILCSSAPLFDTSLQLSTSAQMLKALAMGPKVPAMRGKAVLAYHHLAGKKTFF